MTDNRIVTPCHIQNLIKKILKDQNLISDQELKVRFHGKSGDGWMGSILEIEDVCENYQKEFVAVNLITKLAPTDILYRNFFPVRTGFEREIYVYENILPEFINVQKESRIKNIFSPFAKCYQTLLDETQETVVLENMTKHRYKSVDFRRPVDYQHASMIMVSLGKMHALSFALRNKKPELFGQIGINTEDTCFHCHFRSIYLQIFQNIGRKILNCVNMNSVAYEEFVHFLNDPSFVVDRVVTSEPAGKYAVICHADTQIRNFLFTYGSDLETDTPTNLCFIDWQLCKLGSPCLDIAFFIWICTDKKLRDCHYEELLETYYNSLSSFLRELGECPDNCYPKDVFKKHLKKFSVYGIFLGLWIICLNMSEIENFPEINSADSIESLIDLLSNVANDAYFIRIKDVIEDFVKYDYDMCDKNLP